MNAQSSGSGPRVISTSRIACAAGAESALRPILEETYPEKTTIDEIRGVLEESLLPSVTLKERLHYEDEGSSHLGVWPGS